MRYLICLCLVCIFLNIKCGGRSKEEYDGLYWKFHHVNEMVKTGTENIKFSISDQLVTKREMDTLVNILKQWGWEYHISVDSSIFIRKYGNDVVNAMKGLDDELITRLKDSSINRTINY